MKKHLTTYAFIASLVMGFAGNVTAKQPGGYDVCAAGIKTGTCSHQNGKGKHDCENLWEKAVTNSNAYIHCKWIPGVTKSTGTCAPYGTQCNVK
jgi:hypothetical protein